MNANSLNARSLRGGGGSGTRVRSASPHWLVRWRNWQSPFSIMSSVLPALLLVVFIVDLLYRHSTVALGFAAAWVTLYAVLAVVPLVLGRRFPRWAGLTMVLVTVIWSGYLFAVAGHTHAEINVLLQLPTIALYLGWFFPLKWAAVCMLASLARLGLTLLLDRDLGQGARSNIILVGYAALIAAFCFFGARVVRAQSEKQLSTDSLTQVLNRRGVLVAAEVLLERARRRGEYYAVALVDLDDFKAVNDTDGHAAGDALLASEAQRLRQLLGGRLGGRRRKGLVGRIGGDEFVVLRRGSTDALRTDLERLRQAGTAAWSWGVAHVESGEELADALERADAELYLAKRDRTRVADEPDEGPPEADPVGRIPL